MRPPGELLRQRTSFPASAREVPDELVPVGDEAACDERGLDGRWSRQDGDRHTGVERRRDQPCARIVDSRKAGVRDERDPRSLPATSRAPPASGSLRCAGGSSRAVALHPVAPEEDPRAPRVLAEDEVGLGELLEHAKRHVAQVPDRRGADGERHPTGYDDPSSASNATRAAPTRPASAPSSAATMRSVASAGESASRRAASRAGSSNEVARGLAEASADDDELRIEDVRERADRRPEEPADLAPVQPARSASPARALSTRARASDPGPHSSTAARSAAVPDASASTWPWPWQFP